MSATRPENDPVSKRNKAATKSPGKSGRVDTGLSPAVHPTSSEMHSHPPQKNPALLALSILLLAVWLIFLLVTALRG